MPFTFKLSQRLARMKWGVLAGATLVVACEFGARSVTEPASTVLDVVTAPSFVTLAPLENRQFTAYGRTAAGDSLAVAVSWRASGGSVTSNGLYTAGTMPGTYAVIATETNGTIADTALATVAPVSSPTTPGTVANLSVTAVTANSATLRFTETSDGAGQPASYIIRVAVAPLAWGSATTVAQGTCAAPLAGTTIGATRHCTVAGLTPSTAYQFQLVAFRGTLDVNAVFGALSNVADGTTATSTAPVATVTVGPTSADIAISQTVQLGVTLKDAAGAVLNGRVVTWTSSHPLVATVTPTGLVTGVLVGTSTITATSEGQSGAATITVSTAPSGGVAFQSDWISAIGLSTGAVRDGTNWDNYWEFNNGANVQLLSVVGSTGPGGRNALRVLQRGQSYAANVQEDDVVPLSTDYYVRFYMRNDDVSSAGDHIVTVDTWGYANLTFIRKYGGSSSWRFVSSFYGCGFVYPIGHWGPATRLTNGAWYRFEYHIDFVDATHVQVHPRVYDAAGTLILSDTDFRQEDWGSSSWSGRNDWTLASFYAAGHSFCVDPQALTSFGLGNNGQAGAADTGLPWYFAGIQIRTDRWPGP